MATVTPQDIASQIKSLDFRLNGLDAEAQGLALEAVQGSPEAAQRLAEIRREIGRAKADREILVTAKAAAIAKEAEAEDDSEAEERAAALAEAQTHAGNVTKLAMKADRLIADFRALVGEIDAAERSTHLALRRSGVQNPGFVGSNGLSEHVLSRLDLNVLGSRLSDKRTVEQIASSGWRWLLEIETDETEAA